MFRITVRRRQANAAKSRAEFVIDADDLKRVDRQLRDVLRSAHRERGVGVWSEADPEVWIDGMFIGRLERDGDIAPLVRRTMDQIRVDAASSKRSP